MKFYHHEIIICSVGNGGGVARDLSLTRDAPEIESIVRVLSASVNVRILQALMEERRKSDGWLFLSEIAERINESPGTVGLAIQKLLPLLEEKREKGRRYFRSQHRELTLSLETPRR
jgi:DNA-binding transcriptional ArsR family regulator